MIKLSIVNHEVDILDELGILNHRQVKSGIINPGYDVWFNSVFIPDYLKGGRDVISLRDKRYGTLLGFALLKIGSENKICNLSPLVDGVGMTQAILDASLLYYSKDFTIDVPNKPEVTKLHSKLITLGFEQLSLNRSADQTLQTTYIKPMNIGWI